MKLKTVNCLECFLAAILVACIVVPYSNADLVGYWPLDGDLADMSGQGNDGEIIGDGDPSFEDDVPENFSGQSMYFDGASAILLGNPDILNFGTGDFTISAWVWKEFGPRGNVYSNGGDNGGGIRSVLAIGESGGEQSVVLTLDDDTSKIQPRSGDPRDDLGIGFEPVGAEEEVWNQIVGQRRGNEARVYVNGELADLVLLPDGYDLSGQSQLPAYIGVGASASSDPIGAIEPKWFIGLIDEVAVWDVALSDDDIRSLAEGASVLDVGGVVGCAPLNGLAGDLNGDEKVDFTDFLTLSGNYGTDVSDYESGDIDCNGKVDFTDFLALSGNYGASLGGQAAAVPEPSCGLLFGMGFLALLTRRRHVANQR